MTDFSKDKKLKPKIIVVLGSTATGKSDLAVKLAKDFNGEVISADSRQVYKGMDIGSGKITKKEMAGVPHHLIDVVSPNTDFSVAIFQKKAFKVIGDILERGKVPILCGGTAFYIQAITEGLVFPSIKKNTEFRQELEQLDLETLQKKLKKLDPKRLKEIDQNNPVRLIRAIEIAIELGKVPKIIKKPKYESLTIGLKLQKEELSENIALRLEKRLKKGMVKEVENLHKKRVSWKRLESFGLEYKYIAQYLQGKISHNEMKEKIQTKSEQFAKRQMTWFKKDKKTYWFTPKDYSKIRKLVENFMRVH